jgi:hypothetical protein
MPDSPEQREEPLSAEEEAKLRLSVQMIASEEDRVDDDWSLQWGNSVVRRLLATLDAARSDRASPGGLDVERLRADIEAELDGREDVADDPFNAGALAAYHYVLSRLPADETTES